MLEHPFVNTFVFKLLLAMVLSGLVGLERRFHKKPAGFKTMIMICLGSTMFTHIGICLTKDSLLLNGDISAPGRILGNIITGIGFLGAGAIIKTQTAEQTSIITGLTTAASIWLVAAIGMMCGLGFYPEALTSTAAAVLVLVLFGKYESDIIGSVEKINKKINKTKN